MNGIQYQQLVGGTEWWNNNQRINQITSYMEQIDFTNKTVIETGSRFGIFLYLAHMMGSSYVVGIEQDKKLVQSANLGFQKAQIPPQKYKFVRGNVLKTDMSSYDVILCLGMYYNDVQQEQLLWNCRHAPTILFESWTDQNSTRIPVLTQKIGTKQMPHGSLKGRTVNYTQYLPNTTRLEKQMTEMGFSYTRLSEPTPGHCDMFYLLKSGSSDPYQGQWGINKQTSIKYL